MESADLVLHIFDASATTPPAPLNDREILVANKCDLLPSGSKKHTDAIAVSSLTGEGFDALLDAMTNANGSKHAGTGDSLAAINARHKALLEIAATSLRDAAELVQTSAPPELAAVELRSALDALGRIVGATDTEDILGEIFSRFCIGK
jgi:tRNA modification GTPase